jgi:hypothetical protein
VTFQLVLGHPTESEVLIAESESGSAIGLLTVVFHECISTECQAWVTEAFVIDGVLRQVTMRALLEEVERLASKRLCSEILLRSPHAEDDCFSASAVSGFRDAGRLFRRRLN